jgi:hypothetical protein
MPGRWTNMDHLSLAMPQPYELEKRIWTEADFSRMGWHDAKVYAMVFFSDVKPECGSIEYP